MRKNPLSLFVCVSLVLARLGRAEPDDERFTLLDESFGPECSGWSMTDWRGPSGGARVSGNYVKLDDGLLKVFLGRGMLKVEKDDLWHGKDLSLPVELYGDFAIAASLRWDMKAVKTILQGTVSLWSGGLCVASAGLRDAWAEQLGRGSGEVMGSGLAGTGTLPIAGKAAIRFERVAGVTRVIWDETLLAQGEVTEPVTTLIFTVKGYHALRADGAYAALDHLHIDVPKPRLRQQSAAAAAAHPNLLPGGDFERKAPGSPERDLDHVVVDTEALDGAGIGPLEGWETEVDGRTRVWLNTASAMGKCLRLKAGGPQETTFVSSRLPVEPGAEYRLSGLVRIEAPSPQATVNPTCLIRGHAEAAEKPVILCQPDVAVGVNDWNWKKVTAAFVVRTPGIRFADVVLGVRAGQAEGAALFDRIEVRKATERERQRPRWTELRQNLAGVRTALVQASYRLETAMDVLGFDLDALESRGERADLEAQVTALGREKDQLTQRTDSANRLYRTTGDILQFIENVLDEDMERTQSSCVQLQAETKAYLANLRAQEEALRRRMKGLLSSRPQEVRRDNLEWARDRFHLYWQNHYGLDPPGIDDAFRYMGKMHTSILQDSLCLRRPAEFFEDSRWKGRQAYAEDILSQAQREGIRVLFFGVGVSPHPSGRAKARDAIRAAIDLVGRHDAFAGFEFDEIAFNCGTCPECRTLFRQYLGKKYARKELVQLGVLQEKTEHDTVEDVGGGEEDVAGLGGEHLTPPGDVEIKPDGPVFDLRQVYPPDVEDRDKKKALWMEHQEFGSHLFEDGIRDAFDFAHSLRRDALMVPILSLGPILQAPFQASLARVSALADMIGIDPYWNGCPEEAFYCDLMRSDAKGPTLLTVGTHYGGNVRSLRRDLCIALAHADGMYVFDWPFVFKQPPFLKPEWCEMWLDGRWACVWDSFRRIEAIEKYLVRTRSMANTAMLYSERSSAVDFYKKDVSHGMGGHYSHQQMGLYCLLLQARIPTDAVSAEGLTAEKLSRYAVVVVQNATALTRTQEDTLRRWVQDGGVLIATASTSVQDQWGRPQTDYRLADIFGVKYVRTAQAGDGATFGDDIPVSYPRGFAFDVVEPAGGTVVARWKTGEPAVVRNIFGKGSTLFLSARDLGLCYQGIPRKGITERFPVHKRFLPGVREFLTKSAQDVLQSAGRPTPFRVMNCPDEVETVIRLQGDGRPIRRVLHLLNYGFNEPVSGVRFEIPALPQGASVFYPVDGKKVEFVTDGAMTRFTVRDFDVHEMVVIEEN